MNLTMERKITMTTTNLNEARREQRMMALRILSEDSESKRMTIGGYAIRFETPQTYTYGGQSYTEIIHRSALDNCDMSRVPLRYNHNDSVIVMARTKNSSLRLLTDDFGLKIEADLIDTQSNRDLYKCISDGLIDEMSFAFMIAPGGDTWLYENDYEDVTREINAIEKIYDVSVVDEAFYQSTSVTARSFEQLAEEISHQKEIAALELAKAKAFAFSKI